MEKKNIVVLGDSIWDYGNNYFLFKNISNNNFLFLKFIFNFNTLK